MKYFFTEPHGSVRRPYRLLLPIPKEFLMHVSRIYLLIMISALWAYASPGNGQTIEDTHVTVEFKRESLKNVFDEIEKQSGFFFLSSPEEVSGYRDINLPKGTYPVSDVLRIVLEDTDLKFTGKGKYVMVYREEDEEKAEEKLEEIVGEEESPLKGDDLMEDYQTIVTGIVKDGSRNDEPLAGVNIIVKGTTRGTTTDKDGKFAIEAVDSDVLVFSFIGYKPYEIEVGGRSSIDILMEGDVLALQEIEVNAGYWKVKERQMTGNISRVSREQIGNQPVGNAIAAIQGRMPGVVVTQNSGVPGGGFTIQIRGQNSLRNTSTDNGNLPFFIVDGVPFTSSSLTDPYTGGAILGAGSPLNSINPSDIESIEVLKDADATAIYGSRGANGVVLITTRKAKPGKTRVDLNAYTGIGKVTQRMDLLSTPQYVEMRREGLKNIGYWPLPPALQPFIPDLFLWDTTKYTNWQNELIGSSSHVTSGNVSVSGGDANTQFLIGAGYYKEGTVFPGNSSGQKISGHFNMNHASNNDKFTVFLSASYLNDVNDLPSNDLTNMALKLPPNAPNIYNDDGTLNWMNSTWDNPFSFLKKKYNANTNNLIANTTFFYRPVSFIKLKTSLGYNNIVVEELSTNPISSMNPAYFPTGATNFSNNQSRNWIVEPQAEFEQSVGSGKFSILIGTTFQYSVREGESIFASGYTTDALIENIKAAPTVSVNSGDFLEYKYTALFGRINYIWKNKYIINLTGRRDGSSRFGPDRRFSSFGAAGVAWVFSNEGFIQDNLSFLTYGKLRGSYGSSGSDQIPDYGYLDSYSSTSYPYNGVLGLIPSRLANPEFSWEVTKKLEGGIELGFAKDRILLDVSWYRNSSSSQLVGYPLPVITGFPTVQYNLPATVENTGWEFEFSTTNIKRNNFEWVTNINITIPRNKLVEYPDIQSSPYAYQYEIGKPLSVVKGYHSIGVDPETGLYAFEDLNGNGVGTDFPDEWRGIESVTQDFYGGIQNGISYKGLQLDFLFQFTKQTGYNYLRFFPTPGDRSNQPSLVMDRWRKPGDVATIQRFGANASHNQVINSDQSISDASFIRLKNLSLSYQLPNKLTEKIGVQTRIYVQGQNLLMFTDYLGLDPENQNVQVLPPLRILAAGIQLTL